MSNEEIASAFPIHPCGMILIAFHSWYDTHPSSQLPTNIPTAYLTATLASCTIAVGLSSLVPRLKFIAPASRALLGRFVPFAAVASAGCVNIGLMRWKEIRDGESYAVLMTVGSY
jgi:hypothetical protein